MAKKTKGATTPPPTPQPLTVGNELLHYLKLEKVTHVFQVPGAGCMHILAYLASQQDKFASVICRHESGAAYMADGYYRATGNLGVVLVTSGPGATNALTGVMNANNDGSAVLLISGEISQQFFGLGSLQEGEDTDLDVNALFAASTAYSAIIEEPMEAGTLLKAALRTALSLPRKAAHLSIPDNVTAETIPNIVFSHSPSQYRASHNSVTDWEILPVLGALAKAKRPAIFIGNGCRGLTSEGVQALINVAEYYGVPIISTPDGKGIFPESHDLSMRVFGCASSIWPYYWLNANPGEDPFDFMLVIGSSLGGLATMNFSQMLMPGNGAFYQVDVNPAIIGRCYPLKLGIVGEAGSFILGMNRMKGKEKTTPKKADVKLRTEQLKKIKKTYSPFQDPAQYKSNASPIEPAALMRVIQDTLPKDKETHIFIDAGNCVGWSNHYLEVQRPWSIYSSLSMGPMGFAVGAVVGGKFGRPDATCICITGDGAFMMHGAEVSTARQYNVGAIWIVLNDNNLGMVSQGMNHFFPGTPKVYTEIYELGNPDLVKFAEGLGAKAYRVNNPAQAKTALQKAIKDAKANKCPQVIIADIDALPVPPYYNPLYAPKTN